ncbi:MAG: peptidylprolyl isomerase [Chloroflexi bacterium]|nr:peptidylprolyl isomerase [Chloroflexota bacterium]
MALTLGGCGEKPAPTATPIPAQQMPFKQYSGPPPMVLDLKKSYVATLRTTKGDIRIELFATEAPKTVNNFVVLARDGFYNGVKFHRIVKGFMVQTGDPTGTGAGGPGYAFEDEPVTRDYIGGTVAMANAGPNTNGSQFFIMHGNVALAKAYTIFGFVVGSMDAVNAIAETPVTRSPFGEVSQPLEDVIIKTVSIEELVRP